MTDLALTLYHTNKLNWHLMLSVFSGRHASKVTEEEEDEEYLKGEEDGVANTRLMTQPSCKYPMCLLAWFMPYYISI